MNVSNTMHTAATVQTAIDKNLVSDWCGQMYLACMRLVASGRRMPSNLADFMSGDNYTNTQLALDKLTGQDIVIQYKELEKKARRVTSENFPVMTSIELWQKTGTCNAYLANGEAISLLVDYSPTKPLN